MIRDLIHLSVGRREWEIQGVTDSGYLQFTGAPFLTKAEARRVLPAWRSYDLLTDVRAMNVRTGERLNGMQSGRKSQEGQE